MCFLTTDPLLTCWFTPRVHMLQHGFLSQSPRLGQLLVMDLSDRSESTEHLLWVWSIQMGFLVLQLHLSPTLNATPPWRTPDKDVKLHKHISELDLATHQKVRTDKISFLSVCSLNYSITAAHDPSFLAGCVSRETTEHLTNAEVTEPREINP